MFTVIPTAAHLRLIAGRIRSTRLRTKIFIAAAALLFAGGFTTYARMSRYLDHRLADGALGDSTMLYSAPLMVAAGDEINADEIVSHLQAAGYSQDKTNPIGSFESERDGVIVRPARDSYFREEPVRIRFESGRVAQLTSLNQKTDVPDYALEPQPLVRLEDGALQKRRPVRFAEIPPVLVNALLSAEDKHFFHHAGFDPLRIAKAAFVNVKTGRKGQGGSTLTMQLARNLCLDGDKTWRRKVTELLIAETLEVKLTKEEIFETYVNQVYLGRRNTVGIHGFGQAAETYFGKELSQLTVAEAATLAGLVQRPSYFDPIRHPERVVARRNVVLGMMFQNGLITDAERDAAMQAPLTLAPRSNATNDSQWFVELAMDDIQSHEGAPSKGRLYTTLDPGLQRAAVEAVRTGLRQVDARLAKRKRSGPVQAALVAIDSHTGEVKALVGGRDFGLSQVNHAVAMRQPGSVFKPFVYAAALESERKKFSPATTVVDEPTTFRFEGQDYRPSNFGDHFYGQVTLRRALAKSMNIATISVAEQVGYERVLKVARAAGFNDGLRATPALALGAYEATPLEVAGAYTVFANAGTYVPPTFVSEVRSGGRAVYQSKPEAHAALSPSAAFVVQDMLAEVLRTGTAAGIRAKGFDVPAAGKTGTSRDGWFAGYVSNLICVVWVGFDDNADLDLEGAKSALPIWAEFMQAAARRTAHRGDLGPAPASVTTATIDADTGLLAGPECANVRREYFIRGTEPRSACKHEVSTEPRHDEDAAPPSPVALRAVSYERNANE